MKLVIIDVDGVMCDGKYYNDQGVCIAKQFCDLDFTAIKCMRAVGLNVVFLSGDEFNSGMAQQRGIPFYHSRDKNGVINKSEMLDVICREYECTPEEVIAVGDDYFDVPLLERVGLAFCPYNSPKYVRDRVNIVLRSGSGDNLVSYMLDYLIRFGYIKEPSFEDLLEIDKIENE